MIWTAISLDSRTDMYAFARGGITAAININDILEPIARPHAYAIGDAFILMLDIARAHAAWVSMTYLYDECISVMNWPDRYPDLNPIEHTCTIISRRTRQRPHNPDNLQNLTNALIQEFQTIQDKVISSIETLVCRWKTAGTQVWDADAWASLPRQYDNVGVHGAMPRQMFQINPLTNNRRFARLLVGVFRLV